MAPSRANRSAVAAPMPAAAPVTIAILLFSRTAVPRGCSAGLVCAGEARDQEGDQDDGAGRGVDPVAGDLGEHEDVLDQHQEQDAAAGTGERAASAAQAHPTQDRCGEGTEDEVLA